MSKKKNILKLIGFISIFFITISLITGIIREGMQDENYSGRIRWGCCFYPDCIRCVCKLYESVACGYGWLILEDM